MTIPLLAYLAAPYEDAPSVATWHAALAGVGVNGVDTWAAGAPDSGVGFDAATVAPDLTQDAGALRAIADAEEAQIQTAHIFVVIARAGASYEMVRAAQYAVDAGIPVLWVGPMNFSAQTLTAYRPYVARAANLNAAQTYLGNLATAMQTTLASPGATLYSVRQAILQTITPPAQTVATPDAGAMQLGRRAPADPAPAAPTGGGTSSAAPLALGALVAVSGLAWAIRRRRAVGGR